MDNTNIVAVIVLCVLIGLVSALPLIFGLWQTGMSVAAMLKKKVVYPEIPPQKFAVIVCARNEAHVIGGLLDSLRKQNYPKDCYQVFVVAHNCTDSTAEIALQHGAEVLIYTDPSRKLKSDALKYALRYMNETHSGKFDCFCVFDADCIAKSDFLNELNRGFSLGADAVSGYYDSRNLRTNLVSRLTGSLYHVVMNTTCASQNRLGLPVNIYGTGFAVKMDLYTEVLALHTMVEDFELTTRLVLRGAKLVFTPDAVFYADMPEDLKTAVAQRRRWTYGDLQCFCLYGSAMRRAIPKLGASAVKQYVDLLLVPVCLITPMGILLGLILAGFFHNTRIFLLFLLAVLLLFQTAGSLCTADALKKWQPLEPLNKNLPAILLVPFWLAINIVFSFLAVFNPPVQWEATPHTHQNRQ